MREANVRKFRWSRSRSSCTLKKGSSKNRRRRFRGRSPRATSTGGTPRGFEGDKIQGWRYNRHSQRSLREECRLGAACCDEQHVAPLGGEDIPHHRCPHERILRWHPAQGKPHWIRRAWVERAPTHCCTTSGLLLCIPHRAVAGHPVITVRDRVQLRLLLSGPFVVKQTINYDALIGFQGLT